MRFVAIINIRECVKFAGLYAGVYKKEAVAF